MKTKYVVCACTLLAVRFLNIRIANINVNINYKMEAKELRLGNLIDNDGVIIKTDRYIIKNSNMPTVWEHYKPIPLTEEWLVKFGFNFNEYDSMGWIGSPSDMFYSLCKQGEYYYPYETDNVIQFELKYVHQLQNLYFALTGEELHTQAGGV